jgi:hypothetical protein
VGVWEPTEFGAADSLFCLIRCATESDSKIGAGDSDVLVIHVVTSLSHLSTHLSRLLTSESDHFDQNESDFHDFVAIDDTSDVFIDLLRGS